MPDSRSHPRTPNYFLDPAGRLYAFDLQRQEVVNRATRREQSQFEVKQRECRTQEQKEQCSEVESTLQVKRLPLRPKAVFNPPNSKVQCNGRTSLNRSGLSSSFDEAIADNTEEELLDTEEHIETMQYDELVSERVPIDWSQPWHQRCFHHGQCSRTHDHVKALLEYQQQPVDNCSDQLERPTADNNNELIKTRAILARDHHISHQPPSIKSPLRPCEMGSASYGRLSLANRSQPLTDVDFQPESQAKARHHQSAQSIISSCTGDECPSWSLVAQRLAQKGLIIERQKERIRVRDDRFDAVVDGLEHVVASIQDPLAIAIPDRSYARQAYVNRSTRVNEEEPELTLSDALMLREKLRSASRALHKTQSKALNELRERELLLSTIAATRHKKIHQQQEQSADENRRHESLEEKMGGTDTHYYASGIPEVVPIVLPPKLEPFWYEVRDSSFSMQLHGYNKTLASLDRAFHRRCRS